MKKRNKYIEKKNNQNNECVIKKEENGKVRNGKRKAKMQSDKKGKPFEKINKMMKKIWKKDSKIVIFSTIGSFLIWLVMKLFRWLAYVYMCGYYSFWKIPSTYIEINYQGILWEFFRAAFSILACVLIALIYDILFVNSRFFGRFLLILMLPILLVFIIVIYLSVIFSLDLAVEYFLVNWNKVALQTLIFSVVLWLLFYSVWETLMALSGTVKLVANSIEYMKKQSYSESENNKESHGLKKTVLALCPVIIFVFVTFGVYYKGYNSYSNRTTAEIVIMNESEYIIVSRTNDNWILKKCTVNDDGTILVEKDSLRIQSEMVNDIEIHRFNGMINKNVSIN